MLLVLYFITISFFPFAIAHDDDEAWEGILIAGGNDKNSIPQPYFQIINPRTNKKKIIDFSYNIPRLFNMAAATYDDGSLFKIYFTGGHDTELNPFNGVVLFLHKAFSNQVERVANMIKARGMHTAVSLKGSIYVCGGLSNEFSELNHCEMYDCIKDEWEAIASMQIKRWGHAAVTYKNKMYIFGGRNGWPYMTVLDSVEVYDTTTKKWSRARRMLFPVYSMAAATMKDEIYVCGGTEDSVNAIHSCSIYFPLEDVWKTSPSLQAARYGHSMVPMFDKIYVIGGAIIENEITDSIEEYEYVSGKSRMLDIKLSGPRFYFAAAPVKV